MNCLRQNLVLSMKVQRNIFAATLSNKTRTKRSQTCGLPIKNLKYIWESRTSREVYLTKNLSGKNII